jgi:hypothetical protein
MLLQLVCHARLTVLRTLQGSLPDPDAGSAAVTARGHTFGSGAAIPETEPRASSYGMPTAGGDYRAPEGTGLGTRDSSLGGLVGICVCAVGFAARSRGNLSLSLAFIRA